MSTIVDAPPDVSQPEIELDELVSAIFSKSPGPPHSVVLQLADTAEFEEEPGDPQLEMYVDIALRGVDYLWNKSYKLWELTREQFDYLQRYMHSMGVKLIVRCNEENEDPWEAAENGRKVSFLRISIEWLERAAAT